MVRSTVSVMFVSASGSVDAGCFVMWSLTRVLIH